MQALYTNKGREFISTKLIGFCDRGGIRMKYVTPYIHKENDIVEQGWRIIVIIKNFLLIESGLPLEF